MAPGESSFRGSQCLSEDLGSLLLLVAAAPLCSYPIPADWTSLDLWSHQCLSSRDPGVGQGNGSPEDGCNSLSCPHAQQGQERRPHLSTWSAEQQVHWVGPTLPL